MKRHILLIPCATAAALLLSEPGLAGRQTDAGGRAAAQEAPPEGAAHQNTVEAVSVPIDRTEPARQDTVKAVPTEAAAATNTGLGGRQERPDWRTLTFSSGAFTPQGGVDERMTSSLPALRAAGRGFVYGFVSLNVFLTETIRDELAALGVTLLGSHDSMHKARLPGDAAVLAAVANLPRVEWIGFSTPEQKTSSDIDVRQSATVARAQDDATELNLVVNLFDDDPAGAFREALEGTGAVVGNWDADLRAYFVTASPMELEALIRFDFVLFVEPVLPARTFHDESMALIGADYIRPGNVGGSRYDGSSILLGILDTGFSMGVTSEPVHADLAGKWGCGENTLTEDAGDWEEVWRDNDGHGTHVLGTIAGTGSVNPRYRGVAPGLGTSRDNPIAAAKVFDDDGYAVDNSVPLGMDYLASGCGNRPHVVNYSGGTPPPEDIGRVWIGTRYVSRKLDEMVWEHQQTYVVAAGNEAPRRQSVGEPAAAKNALTVGNVLDHGFETVGDRHSTSSIGVTGDLRMKPNLVAPGARVKSARTGTEDQYVDLVGTSMAAPHVSGLIATLMEHYSVFRYRPALVRAHLMATSILHDNDTRPDRAGISPRRDEYGLGRVSSYLAHWAQSGAGGWSVDRTWGEIAQSTYESVDVVVPSGAQRLVAVAAWDEPAPSAGAQNAVLYDYDLWIDRNGDCRTGNCGEWASTSREDNVEYVIVENPPAGTYKVKLHPFNGRGGDGVPYGMSIKVVNGDPTPSMNLTPTFSTSTPIVGQEFTITTTVSAPSYIASGVHLALTDRPAGSRHTDTRTTRADGVTMRFPEVGAAAAELTLGNVVRNRSRRVTWKFVPTAEGIQDYEFRAWSENGGTRRHAVRFDVQPLPAPAPDLIVQSVRASDTSVTPGQSFTLSAVVRNQGSAPHERTQILYYRSSDATIDRNDTWMGRADVPRLAAGATATTSLAVDAPADAGTHYYGACVDGHRAERDATNNCSRGFAVTVTDEGGDASTDRGVLEMLYNTTNGPGWTNNANWNTNAPLNQWVGVTTDADGRVIELTLPENNLSGSIPSALGDLTSLVHLSLERNQLTGRIPAELGYLANLETLFLYTNELSGPIPAVLGSLINLKDLFLWGNQLTGPIPAALDGLANLERLVLSRNALSGPIPPALARLTNLTLLNLKDNELTGPVPRELAQLTRLEWLQLGGNQLSGPLAWLGGMTTLLGLDLWNLGLSGPIPTWLRNLTDLKYLRLTGNALSGPIPTWVGDLRGLWFLSLHGNALSGPVPSELGNLSMIQDL